MKLYHGSNVKVNSPKILTNGYFKDFGYGFYCTNIEKQAKRWALTRHNAHIVSIYEYTPNDALNTISFETTNKQWLEFIVNCRRGVKHNYDVVEGAMADDTIWDYVEDYVDGKITEAAFWELIKFKYPTHQIVFCSEAALSTLEFKGSYAL